MSWQPNGRYYTFSPEVIYTCVPPSSGVYGLFNVHYQLLIGEAENLQEVLLRQHNDCASLPRRHRPTGFAFQLSSPDVRKRKAGELIERFHPVRQTGFSLINADLPAADPAESELPLGELDASRVDLEEFSMHEQESPPADRPGYFNERAQRTTLVALFGVCMAGSFYLGMLTADNRQRQADRQSAEPLATTQVAPSLAAPIIVDAAEQNVVGSEMAGDLSADIPGWMPRNMEAAASTAGMDQTLPAWVPGKPTVGALAHHAGTTLAPISPASPPETKAAINKKWSVQIAAAPARDIADALAGRLKSDGYDSYVVQAQVKGETVYRVRVGSLDGQDQAESLRQSLADQEGFRDAFLTTQE